MNKVLGNLPEYKRDELEKILAIILEHAKVEMVILFGSHVKDSWVSHKYVKDDNVYEYNSDFDLLIVVKNKKMEEDFGVWDAIESECYKQGVRTWISLIVDNIHDVNEQLALGRYFYSEVKKEGVLLYDAGNYELAEPRILTENEKKDLAKQDYDYWFSSANYFLDDCRENLKKGRLSNAAFNLHQAVERFVAALLLVYTGYRPKTHDLKSLMERAQEVDPDIWKVFFAGVDAMEERRLFELLRRAYVDARYERSYEISGDELTFLLGRVVILSQRVEEFCLRKF